MSRKKLAWNGITMLIPISWEPIFTDNTHLVFEKNFTPQLQLRWEKVEKASPAKLSKRLDQFPEDLTVVTGDTISREWSAVHKRFTSLHLATTKNNRITSGIFVCMEGKIIFLFQILDQNSTVFEESAKSLASLRCHDSHKILWEFQDFSFITPNEFTLKNYTFAAGLTRVSFKSTQLNCHICRLIPADQRLEEQSLEQILETLVDAKAVSTDLQFDLKTCCLTRRPSIWQQIRYRLRRQHPFILAKIYHHEKNNHLLAVVLTSKQPISLGVDHFFEK